MDRHRCADCGFLAIRLISSRELVDAEKTYRETGIIPITRLGSGAYYGRGRFDEYTEIHYERYPICFRLVANLRGEIEEDDSTKSHLETITRERECDQFTDWQQGFTPKEHAQMINQAWLHERQERWDQEREKRDRERDERDREWRKEDLRLARQSLRSNIVCAFVGFFAALAAVALTYLLDHWPTP